MNRKIVLVVIAVLLIIVSVSVLRIMKLYHNIGSYAHYWQSRSTENGEFVYVALGDSAAQGLGASAPEKGYVGLLADRIQQTTGKTVRVVNLSVSGAKIQDVIQKQLPELQKYKPDLLTVEIGANDVNSSYDKAQFQKDYDELASKLPKQAIVADIPYFGGIVRKNKVAIEASQSIVAEVQKYHLALVNLQAETKQRQSFLNYSADYFHPTDRGYRIWADAFWMAIEPKLSSTQR
jgi:acyl-CoA thioesterase-1